MYSCKHIELHFFWGNHDTDKQVLNEGGGETNAVNFEILTLFWKMLLIPFHHNLYYYYWDIITKFCPVTPFDLTPWFYSIQSNMRKMIEIKRKNKKKKLLKCCEMLQAIVCVVGKYWYLISILNEMHPWNRIEPLLFSYKLY